MVSREEIMQLIADEKEIYSQYSQLCAHYQIQPAPIAIAKYEARLAILQKLLQGTTPTKKS